MNGTFEVGKTYKTSAIGDHNMIYTVKVLKRTAKTVTVETKHDGIQRFKIHIDPREGYEFIRTGSYRGAPIFTAEA